VLAYTLAVVAGYFMLCASIKWQPWTTRLDLPVFILAAPIAGIALSEVASTRVTYVIGLLLLSLTLQPLLRNTSHPLAFRRNIFNLGRESAYFLHRPELATPYIQTADFLASQHCNTVSVAMEFDDYEYPLWVLLRDRLGRWPMIQMVPTSGLPDAWQDINCVVILEPQLRDRVFALEPSELWDVRVFGSVTVETRR
jgi:hypothetical protein